MNMFASNYLSEVNFDSDNFKILFNKEKDKIDAKGKTNLIWLNTFNP